MVTHKSLICKILLVSVVRLKKSDEGLSHILPNKDVFEVTSKNWHMYIKTFLHKVISKSHLFTVEESFYCLDSDIKIFSKYSQERLLKPVQPNYTLIVTRASGRLDLVDVGIFVYFAEEFRMSFSSATCGLYLDSSDGCQFESTFKI